MTENDRFLSTSRPRGYGTVTTVMHSIDYFKIMEALIITVLDASGHALGLFRNHKFKYEIYSLPSGFVVEHIRPERRLRRFLCARVS